MSASGSTRSCGSIRTSRLTLLASAARATSAPVIVVPPRRFFLRARDLLRYDVIVHVLPVDHIVEQDRAAKR
jgi:hypothetical protein